MALIGCSRCWLLIWLSYWLRLLSPTILALVSRLLVVFLTHHHPPPPHPVPGVSYEEEIAAVGGISSVRVPAGVHAVLYGGHFVEPSFRAIRNVGDISVTSPAMNDATRTIKLSYLPIWQLNGVVLCTDANFGGTCQYYPMGDHTELGADMINGISSMQLPGPGYEVLLWADANMNGQAFKADANVSDFSRIKGLNDNIESVRINPTCK